MSRRTVRFALLSLAALGMVSACDKLVGDFDFGSSSAGGTGGSGGAPSTVVSSARSASSTGSTASTSSGGQACFTVKDCPAKTACEQWACQGHVCEVLEVFTGKTCDAGVCDPTGECVPCFNMSGVSFGCAGSGVGKSYCYASACASCGDTTMNGDETDVDCGGENCGACADKKTCKVASDCLNANCDMGTHTCISCMDGLKNGLETDVDCGGSCTTKCGIGRVCAADMDCTSNKCTNKLCDGCQDGVKDGDETGVDCGGSCKACNGSTCSGAGDCGSGFCVGGVCCNAACTDNFSGSSCESCTLPGQVGTCIETPMGEYGNPVCGVADMCDGNGTCTTIPGFGTASAKKADGQLCTVNGDCDNANCKLGACRLKPGDYCTTGIECDSGLCSAQHLCVAACLANTDCASGVCAGGICKLPIHAACGSSADCSIGACPDGYCSYVNGQACTVESDCVSHRCALGICGACSANADCTSNSCVAGKCLTPSGDYCEQGAECTSGFCVGTAASPLFRTCP